MQLLDKLKGKITNTTAKLMVGAMAFALPLVSSIPAHAEASDISAVTGQITTALSAAKTDFVTALGAVVSVALGFFVVKFVVKQVIKYFSQVASK